MKKLSALLLALSMLFALAGCLATAQQQDTITALEGSWSSEDEKLSICGSQVEITGYYEYDGQRMAGVVTEGKLEVYADGTFTIETEGYTRSGSVVDESTIMIDNILYTR